MAIKRAYKTLYKSGLSLDEAKAAIEAQQAEHVELQPLGRKVSVPLVNAASCANFWFKAFHAARKKS